VFVASGDSGSYPNSSGFYYPAEDAYITAVGGTDLTTNGPGGSWKSETAWPDSGGGISPDDILIPPYQQLWGVINSSNKGSTVYRNVPDVAAEANTDNYYCANGGCGEGLGGTSLAAPTWAGFAALVNQENVANGAPTLGFLNPLIYGIGVGSIYSGYFHDITSGSNGAYSAVPGYDLVTGWGSPNPTGWFAPNFIVTVTPASQSVAESQGTSYTVTVTPWSDFTGSVTLSVAGLPSGASGTFNPNPVTGGSGTSTLSITTSATTPVGSYTISLKGTSGTLVDTTTADLVVNPVCTASPGCTGSGNVCIAYVSLSCVIPENISTQANACGAISNGPSGLLTQSSAGAQTEFYGSGFCYLSWTINGQGYQVELYP